MPLHKGSCHCKAITFEFEAPAEGMVAWDCNCECVLLYMRSTTTTPLLAVLILLHKASMHTGRREVWCWLQQHRLSRSFCCPLQRLQAAYAT
jgi:hypothetical protein